MTTSIRIFTTAMLAAAAVSCSPQSADQYDTAPATAGPQTAMPPATPTNPVYDTPAVYEETSAVTPAPADVPVAPTSAPAPPPANGAALIHTVVSGDTLSGISAKYKIPSASIKQANKMTADTVVLGRKMVIPPR